MADRTQQGPDTDELVLLLLVVGGIALLIARRDQILGAVGHWLQSRHILTDEADGPPLVPVGTFGGLDSGRILVLLGATLIAGTLMTMWWLHRRSRR